MAAKLKLYRGVSYPARYNHTDSDGNPLSLSGCKVLMTIKKGKSDDSAGDTDPLTTIFKIDVTTHVDAEAGISEWEVLIPATGVKTGNYTFDVIVQDASGKKLPPMIIGECEVLPKPTNRS